MSVLLLTEARARAAQALAPTADGDFPVLVDVVDAIDPPVILLVWGDPWLTPNGFGPCVFTAQLDVLCVASRVEPGPGMQTLEQMATYVIERMRVDAYPWPQVNSQAPRRLVFAGVEYLSAFLTYDVRVTTEGS